MPLAGDAFLNGPLPAQNNPLIRMGSSVQTPLFDLAAFLNQWTQFVETYLFPIIKNLTGVDLTALAPILKTITDFIGSFTGVFSGSPLSFFTSLFNLFGGAANMGQAGNFFTNLLSLFGNPLGLLGAPGGFNPATILTSWITGTINPLNLLTTVTDFTSLLNIFGGTGGGLSSVSNVFTNLLKLFNLSGVTGLSGSPGSFSPTSILTSWITGLINPLNLLAPLTGGLLSLGNIPGLPTSQITSGTFPMSMVTNLLSLFEAFAGVGGSLTNATNMVTNLLKLFNLSGVSGLTGSPGSFNPSSILSSWITTLINPLGLLATLSGGIIPTGQIPNITLGMSTDLQSVVDKIFQGLNNSTATGNPVSSVLSSIQTVPTDITNALMGLSGTWGHTDSSAALQSQTDIVKGNAAQIAQLKAALAKGTSDSDAFERTSSTNLGTGWDQYYSTTGLTWATPNGHDASWSGTAGDVVCRKVSTVSTGDLQIVQVALATAAGSWPFPAANGQDDIWCRMSTFTTWATRTGMRMRFGADKSLKLSAFNSGAETVLWSGTTTNQPAAGALLEFDAGMASNPRRFVAKINGIVVMDFTETGTTSQLGAGFRKWGHGARAEVSGIVTFSPGSMSQWTAQDGV